MHTTTLEYSYARVLILLLEYYYSRVVCILCIAGVLYAYSSIVCILASTRVSTVVVHLLLHLADIRPF